MVDKVSNVGASSNVTNVSSTKATSTEDISAHGNGYAGDAGDDLEIKSKTKFEQLEELLENGTLKEGDKKGTYVYTCNGEMTLKEIKEQLDLWDGVISKRNSAYISEASKGIDKSRNNYLDYIVPKEGDELSFNIEDFPRGKADIKDNDGNTMPGFEKSLDGKLYYVTQDGDSSKGLKAKFKGVDSLKDYSVNSLIGDVAYRQESYCKNDEAGVLPAGIDFEVPEKNGWQKFWNAVSFGLWCN